MHNTSSVVGAKASGAGSSPKAVTISSLLMAGKEKKGMHRLLLILSNSCAVPQQFVYFKEKEGLPLTVQRGRILHNLVFVLLMATHKPSARGDPHGTEMSI